MCYVFRCQIMRCFINKHNFFKYSALSGDVQPMYVVKKVKVCSYVAQYPILRIAQLLIPVQSDTISTSLGSIQPYATVNAQRLLVHISTIVYSQVLIYIAE